MKELLALSKKQKLLFVEDDANLRMVTHKLLSNFFESIEIAENGKEGLAKFRDNHFDLVISDLQMPIMDGIEMIEQIKEIKPNQTIVVTSAYDDSSKLLRLINLGVDFFIQKPIESTRFFDVLKKAVERIEFYNMEKNYKKYLEETVESRTKELKKLNEELTLLDQLKDDFLETISHELKTPLTSILGYADFLLEIDDEPEKKKRIIGIIVQESEKLQELIEDVLYLTTLGTDKLEYKLQQVSISDLLDESIAMFKDHPEIKKETRFLIELSVTECQINCDIERMKRVFHSIFENSYHFSPDEVVINIHIECQNNQLKIIITDQGVGIPEDKIDQVFNKFYKTRIKGFEIRGTGIGLTIAKGIIEAHDGKIWAEPSPKGAKVVMSLPLCKE
ncbi:MAG: hybrid sensor histidine kinase/response regulator [Deltaproteobacteria bacterium]|nr:hybrid sensor histidine kinase/response regulator [Deltaproteobacteria bacterium]